MVRSFRLRLALLLALVSGITLAAFATAAWWLIRDANVQQVDALLRSEVEREVLQERTPEAWDFYAATLSRVFTTREASQTLLLVMESGGGVRYRSTHWPADFDGMRLSWPPARLGSEIQGGVDAGSGTSRTATPMLVVTQATVNGRPWKLGLASLPNTRMAIGVSLANVEAEMVAVRNAFLLAIPLILVLTGLTIWAFSTRAMRPVKHLTTTIRSVTAQGLNRRIESSGQDREFSDLIEVFNDMLNRLERGFTQASRFSADAAHELKTPLAILQGQVERAIGQAPEGSPLQSSLTGILDEIRRLSAISQKLLLLAQADAGQMRLLLTPVDVSMMLDELVDDVQMLAPALLTTSDIARGLTLNADAVLLKQVLHNLISNAIKYNIEDGWVTIQAAGNNGIAEITVANASHGIPDEQRAKIFERFYRADPARSRQIDGVGLGLSVSLEIARAHGGDLLLMPGQSNETRFTLRLPMPAG